MTAEQILNLITIAAVVLCAASVLFSIIHSIVFAWRRHRIRNAPVFTKQATVYLKHEETDLPYLGRGSTPVHYVTFHTHFGEAVRLYMIPREFYALNEGDTGTLTWQGEKFWEFTPDPE